MKTAFQYRPRFVDIRVRPPKPEEAEQAADAQHLKPGERPCDHQGCRLAGTARAPAASRIAYSTGSSRRGSRATTSKSEF